MLNGVPNAINKMARNVVIHHPNSANCQVFRKTINRDAPKESGMPTMGGLGVISSEDEEDISWEWIGNGYVLPAEQFSPGQLNERRDASNGPSGVDEFRFLIEPEEEPGTEKWFEPAKGDVFYLIIGDIVKLAFEIVDTETTIGIPPYTRRFVCNRRDDLHVIAPSEEP